LPRGESFILHGSEINPRRNIKREEKFYAVLLFSLLEVEDFVSEDEPLTDFQACTGG